MCITPQPASETTARFLAQVLVESGARATIVIKPLGTGLKLVPVPLRLDSTLISGLPDDTDSLLAVYPVISASKQVQDT